MATELERKAVGAAKLLAGLAKYGPLTSGPAFNRYGAELNRTEFAEVVRELHSAGKISVGPGKHIDSVVFSIKA